MTKRAFSFILLLFAFSLFRFSLAEDLANAGPTRNPQFANTYDVNNPGALLPEEIVAHSFILIERNSEDILMSRNEMEQMFPGSATKIMTALVALQYGDLDDIIVVSPSAMNVPEDGTTVGLKVGEQLTFKDALYGMLLRSGNEASLLSDDQGRKLADRIVMNAIGNVANIRGRLGAIQKGSLEPNVMALQDSLVALTEANAMITNADFAVESSNLTRLQLLIQAGAQTLGIANQLPQYAAMLVR